MGFGLRMLAIGLLVLCACMLALGLRSLYHVQGGQQITVSVEAMEQGAQPGGRWLKVEQCRALWSRALCVPNDGFKWYFVPVVSQEWVADAPVAVLLQCPVKPLTADDQEPMSYSGMTPLDRRMDASLLAATRAAGLATSSNCVVLALGGTAAGEREQGVFFLYLSPLPGLLAAALLWLARSWESIRGEHFGKPAA